MFHIAFSDIDAGRIATNDALRVAVTEATRSGMRYTCSLTAMAVSEAMPSIAASYAQRSNEYACAGTPQSSESECSEGTS